MKTQYTARTARLALINAGHSGQTADHILDQAMDAHCRTVTRFVDAAGNPADNGKTQSEAEDAGRLAYDAYVRESLLSPA